MAAILGCGVARVCDRARGTPSFIADDSPRPLKTPATLHGGLTLLECPLAESQMRPLAEPPVLSIVVPSYHRSAELVQAVTSLADQLTGGLERKVEIIISDNDSEPNTVGAIRGHFTRLGYTESDDDRVSRLADTAKLAGYDGDLLTTNDLTGSQAARAIRALTQIATAQELVDRLQSGEADGG